jgi:hypothetical protein
MLTDGATFVLNRAPRVLFTSSACASVLASGDSVICLGHGSRLVRCRAWGEKARQDPILSLAFATLASPSLFGGSHAPPPIQEYAEARCTPSSSLRRARVQVCAVWSRVKLCNYSRVAGKSGFERKERLAKREELGAEDPGSWIHRQHRASARQDTSIASRAIHCLGKYGYYHNHDSQAVSCQTASNIHPSHDLQSTSPVLAKRPEGRDLEAYTQSAYPQRETPAVHSHYIRQWS